MKIDLKIFIILLIDLFIGFNTFSQYKIGLQGGAGISNYVGKDFPPDNEPKFGITAGFFFEREINLTLSFGTEFNYDQKGTFYQYDPRLGTTVKVDSRLKYLTLPAYIKAYFGKQANYYLYLGVAGSYLINYESSDYATENGFEISSAPYFPFSYNSLDASVIGGCGLNFYRIILDIRYHHGIVNIYGGHNVPSIRNSFISATLGFTLYKKKVLSCFNNRAY